ncbi:MAG: DUF6316 family protein [Gammaproteobacteria bacterium]|nr:DUF6316 family protein [Gammaproteobacteria bacterium]
MKTTAYAANKKNRYGESGKIPVRGQRIFCQNNEWYFHTREYGVYGPYQTIVQAKDELRIYLRRHGIVKLASF